MDDDEKKAGGWKSINNTNSPAAKAQVKRMIKWLSLK
jgi:hypothetical protein